MIEKIIKASRRADCPFELREIPFGEGFWSWTEVAEEGLKKRVGDTLNLLYPEALFALKRSLVERWAKVAAPSLVLEMRIASHQGILQGTTPEEKYRDFLKRTFWEKEGLNAFFNEYQEVARYILLFLEQWTEHHAEFLLRLKEDLPLLQREFGRNSALGKISFLSKSLSDFHNGGRSVLELGFEQGLHLLYKPKNLGITHAFYSFLSWCNEQEISPAFQTYKILVRDGYGWEEKVEHAPCATPEEAGRFFERSGMLLSLFYLLYGTDAHQENIIAAKEHPFFVDLETLFHGAAECKLPKDEKMAEHSVLNTLFLPTLVENPSDKPKADLSGLGGGKNPLLTSKIHWENVGTDEMEMVRKESLSQRCENYLVLNGEVQNASFYVEEIVQGFRKMYFFILERRKALLEKDGWIQKLSAHPVRFVFRPTRHYCHLFEHLVSPQVSLHEQERMKKWDLLSEFTTKKEKSAIQIVNEEKKALTNGDIPYFFSLPDTPHLYADRTVIENALVRPALQDVILRLQTMDEKNCSLQEELIRLSLAQSAPR